MTGFRWFVFTNCAEGREAEFNAWYDEVHVPDLLRVPGIVGVSRSRVAAQQIRMLENGDMEHCGPEHLRFRYLAIYDFETEDPKTILDEVRARANTPEMMITPHLADVETILYEGC